MLYLVRHGRTAYNAAGRLLGRLDVPLDDLGRRQAAALGSCNVLKSADRVISSPLSRALDTAAALGLPVETDDRWTEIDYGVHDGADLSGVGELWRHWADDLEYAPDGGESLAAVGRRVRAACEELWQVASEVDVVVVSHVSPLKSAVAWALGVGDEVCWRMYLDVASVSRVGLGARGFPTLRGYNDTTMRPSD